MIENTIMKIVKIECFNMLGFAEIEFSVKASKFRNLNVLQIKRRIAANEGTAKVEILTRGNESFEVGLPSRIKKNKEVSKRGINIGRNNNPEDEIFKKILLKGKSHFALVK